MRFSLSKHKQKKVQAPDPLTHDIQDIESMDESCI